MAKRKAARQRAQKQLQKLYRQKTIAGGPAAQPSKSSAEVASPAVVSASQPASNLAFVRGDIKKTLLIAAGYFAVVGLFYAIRDTAVINAAVDALAAYAKL